MIKWQLTASSQTRDIALAACLSPKSWVFRGTHYIFAWNELQGKLNWRVDLKDDQPLGVKRLACMPGLTISFADLGRKDGARFVCVDQNSGEIIWQKTLAFSPKEFGLAAIGKQVIVQTETSKGEPRLLVIDGMTGDLVADLHSVPGQYAVGSSGHLFVGGQDGLYVTDLDKPSLKKILNGTVHSLTATGKEIYFLLEDENTSQKTILWWDSITIEKKGHITLPLDTAWILPTATSDFSRIAIRLGDKQGIALLDFRAGEIVWRAGRDKQWTLSKIERTSYGLAVLVQELNNERKVYILCEKDGSILSSPETQYSPESIFWYKERLIVSGFVAGMQAFAVLDDSDNPSI